MKINKNKHIGQVLFVVEGSSYEFTLLERIFCDILGFSFIKKSRNNAKYYVRENDYFSRIAVINTKESNIKDITDNEEYLENIYETLIEEYEFPVDQSAIFFLFDRDPKSNTDIARIKKYISELKNPYENDNFKAGQLLLNYPSIESYTVSCFRDNSCNIFFKLGQEVKDYINKNTDIQIDNIDENRFEHAVFEFMNFLKKEDIVLNIDDFSADSDTIFNREERYLKRYGFKLFSMLTLAFMQLDIVTEF